MKKTIASAGIKLAILGTALAASGAAFAADPGGSQRQADRPGHHACHSGHHGFHGFQQGHPHLFHQRGKAMHGHAHMRRAGLIVPGYGVVSRDFVEGMGLNESQLKLLEDARKASTDLRENHRDRMKAQRGERRERLGSAIDPEQALKQADERREQMRAERRQLDEKWVAVWKSLDSAQQARVAEHLKQRAEKAQARADKRAEKFQEHRQQREAAKQQPA